MEKKYKAVMAIQRNGTFYPPGSEIMLADDAAAGLPVELIEGQGEKPRATAPKSSASKGKSKKAGAKK